MVFGVSTIEPAAPAAAAPISLTVHETLALPLTDLPVAPIVRVRAVPQLAVVMSALPLKLVPLILRAVASVVAVVALPDSAAVIVPAVKLPEPSRATIALAVFALVAVVALLLTLPAVLMVASLVSAIAADALMSALTMVPSAIIVLVTVPLSPVVMTVPVVAGSVIVVVPAAAAGCSVKVPDVEPGIATLLIPVRPWLAEARFNATDVVPTNSEELPSTPVGMVPLS